jgi:hypothetical protein
MAIQPSWLPQPLRFPRVFSKTSHMSLSQRDWQGWFASGLWQSYTVTLPHSDANQTYNYLIMFRVLVWFVDCSMSNLYGWYIIFTWCDWRHTLGRCADCIAPRKPEIKVISLHEKNCNQTNALKAGLFLILALPVKARRNTYGSYQSLPWGTSRRYKKSLPCGVPQELFCMAKMR